MAVVRIRSAFVDICKKCKIIQAEFKMSSYQSSLFLFKIDFEMFTLEGCSTFQHFTEFSLRGANFCTKKGLKSIKVITMKGFTVLPKIFPGMVMSFDAEMTSSSFFFFLFWAAAIFDPPSWISWLLHNVRKPKMCESDIERKINITARKEILGKITRFGVQG